MTARVVGYRADSTTADDSSWPAPADTSQMGEIYRYLAGVGQWRELLPGSDDEPFYQALCAEVKKRVR